jgi:hypothetical protein
MYVDSDKIRRFQVLWFANSTKVNVLVVKNAEICLPNGNGKELVFAHYWGNGGATCGKS